MAAPASYTKSAGPEFSRSLCRYTTGVGVVVYVPPTLLPELGRKLDVAAALAALKSAAAALERGDSIRAMDGAGEALARIYCHAQGVTR